MCVLDENTAYMKYAQLYTLRNKVSEPDICKNSQAKLTRSSQVGEIFTGLVDHFPSQE